jgi:hypothetical protein
MTQSISGFLLGSFFVPDLRNSQPDDGFLTDPPFVIRISYRFLSSQGTSVSVVKQESIPQFHVDNPAPEQSFFHKLEKGHRIIGMLREEILRSTLQVHLDE